jgi:hypothetical protein
MSDEEVSMATTLLEPRQVLEETAPLTLVPASEPQPTVPAAAEGRELMRWVRWLGIPFVLSAVFFGAAIGTGQLWLMGLAWGFGPELIILGYIYLSISSEANSELPLPAGQ